MFHYDRGLFLTAAHLAVDVPRRQAKAFVSHAHADHIARHELALCTPDTARLYQHRLGQRRVWETPFGRPIELGPLRLTALPAGHVLGSAMLLAEHEGRSLLYTGDFRLGPSATAQPAELPHADVLVMECTFGDPRYRLPPREQVVAELIELVRDTIRGGATPVIHAYALGKAQEVTKTLTDADIPVQQHPDIYAVSQVYERCGCALGKVLRYDGAPRPGCALVVPPRNQRARRVAPIARKVTIAVTGWAADPSTKYRLGVDHALPLSDHADYDQLLEAVRCVGPEIVYCTHGPEAFVDRLAELGWDARPLGRAWQKRLF